MFKLLQLTALGLFMTTNLFAQTDVLKATVPSHVNYSAEMTTRADAEDLWIDHVATEFAGGTGTEADPYQIATPEQFFKILNEKEANNGKYYKQTADLDFSLRSCHRQGGYYAFKGQYDGNGFKMKGWNLDRKSATEATDFQQYLGIFPLTNQATLKNITVEGVTVSVDYSNLINYIVAVSSLCGYSYNSVIENCHIQNVQLNASLRGDNVNLLTAGIAALAVEGQINNCSIEGTIHLNMTDAVQTQTSSCYLMGSGIVGQAQSTHILNCVNYADIEGTMDNTGANFDVARCAGIVAYGSETQVQNCANLGDMNAEVNSTKETPASQVAGVNACLVNGSIVQNCWNAGSLTSNAYTEGNEPKSIVCHAQNNITIVNCYFDESKKNAVALDETNEQAFSTEYMQSQEFVDLLNKNLTADMDMPWYYVPENYPSLQESGSQTANESITTSAIYQIVENGIQIQSEQPLNVRVYTISGVQVTNKTVQGSSLITLPEGLYIIQMGDQTMKVKL